jgi:outer membrane protein assembly factor BamB
VNTIEFLNRISFFSILSWSFFLIAVMCALILTNLRSPFIRKYRKTFISVSVSGLMLGLVCGSTPLFLRKLNPDQSRLTPIDQLTITQWLEPVSNPETELADDEIAWLKSVPFRFKFKLEFSQFQFQRVVAIQEGTIVLLDQNGTFRGFNAYNGLNHWAIALQTQKIISSVQVQKKLYVLDRVTSPEALRVSCIDLQNPSMIWQRTIPNSKEGALSFDAEAQAMVITTGANGVWAVLARTGEIIWKRPEIYTKTIAIPSPKHLLVFEPVVANRSGAWYFLDLMTGKTLQKTPNVFPEIQTITPIISENSSPTYFLAQVKPDQFFYMNHVDLSTVWNATLKEPAHITLPVDSSRYLVLYDSKLLELRKLSNNEIIWQKTFSESKNTWLKITPDHQSFVLQTEATDGNAGVAFYQLDSGDYQFTASTSEPITDISFYGDWFYLFSEQHVWAFQKKMSGP